MPTNLPPRRKKSDLFVAAAKDFCSRKRDTLIYLVAVPSAVFCEHQLFGTHYIATNMPAVIAAREGIREKSWTEGGKGTAPNLKYAYAARAVVGACLSIELPIAALQVHAMIGGPLVSVEAALMVEAPFIFNMVCESRRSLRRGDLTVKGLAKLYKDTLFDYHDKNDPKGPKGGARRGLNKLLERLRPDQVPNPV